MPQPDSRPLTSRLVPVVVVVAAAFLIVVAMGLAGSGGNDTSQDAPAADVQIPEGQEAQPDATLADVAERRDADDLLAVGPVDAPVVLVAFSDYQCPYCAKWSAETLPAMMKHVEAGDLRIEWRDLNIFGEASERAARATYAAAQQDALWEYHDALFPAGDKRPASELTDAALTGLAGEMGLDTDRFAKDMASDDTRRQITANAQLGRDLGATSTPAFVIGGVPVVGAQPTEVFEQAFQKALAAAE